MMRYIIIFLIFCTNTTLAQKELVAEDVNETYHLLFTEHGVKNKIKRIELGDNNGKIVLTISVCDTCIPAVYTYQEVWGFLWFLIVQDYMFRL